MSLAEQLYKERTVSHVNYDFYAASSIWIDTLFILTIAMIHLIYSAKFTVFSLAYLKAKCEEKKTQTTWSESKLYLHTVCCSDPHLFMKDGDDEKQIYCKLWMDLSFLRNVVRVLLFLSCCILVVLYLSVVVNILYEYLVYCVVYYANGAFLALFVLPFVFWIALSFLRFFVYATSSSLSINLDQVANHIASQQSHIEVQQYAHNIESHAHLDRTLSVGTVQRRTQLRETIRGFGSAYFMAVHWRLCIILCSAIATSLALYFAQSSADLLWYGFFLRYVCIATAEWMTIYVCLCVGSGIYGIVRTFPVFTDVLNEERDDHRHVCFRIFCLKDAFMVRDRNICWRNWKLMVYLLLCVSGVLCTIIGCAIQNGLVRFVGLTNMMYYVVQVLIIGKVRGLHCLWKADMVSMELKDLCSLDTCSDHVDSHAARMVKIGLKDKHMQQLLGKPATNMMIRAGSDNDFDVEMDQKEEAEQLLDVEHAHQLQSEEDILTLYTSTHTKLYNERRRLHEQRHEWGWCQLQFKLLKNYFHIMFQLYTIYWFLILPYNYEVRPLSHNWSGNSISERIARYNYTAPQETVKSCCKSIWRIIRYPACCLIVIVVWLALIEGSSFSDADLWRSTSVYNDTSHDTNRSAHLQFGYGICDLQWNANLSVFELSTVTAIAYYVKDTRQEQRMSMQEIMCVYFDGIKLDELNTTDVETCSWQVIYIRRKLPAFVHMRHGKTHTDLIIVRGTLTMDELLQDIALFNEVAILQAFSWVIPITTILPQDMIIGIMHLASMFEGSINMEIRHQFDEPLFEYVYDYLSHTNNTLSALYLSGHSLGGAISQIVASQLYRAYQSKQLQLHQSDDLEIKSFSVSAPGLVWNSRKFSIDVGDLYKTSTVVNPNHDAMTGIDKTGGLTQKIECNQEWAFECHNVLNTIAELSDNCEVEQSSLIDIGIVCRIMQNRVANHADLSLQIEQLTGYGNKKILKTFCGVL
eukprot:193942_1